MTWDVTRDIPDITDGILDITFLALNAAFHGRDYSGSALFHRFQDAGASLTPTLRHTGAPTGPEQQMGTAERCQAVGSGILACG